MPVRDPLIAVVALYETWSFDATPTVLSNGPNELPYILGAPPFVLKQSGKDLIGTSSNGVVQLTGTFTSIHFTVPAAATGDFTGFTVGIRGRP